MDEIKISQSSDENSDNALAEKVEGGQLTIDVIEKPDYFLIRSAVAGVKPEDIKISIVKNRVTIKGSRHEEEKIKEDEYLYQECYWGDFSRSVILPKRIDSKAAHAEIKNGILLVKLPFEKTDEEHFITTTAKL